MSEKKGLSRRRFIAQVGGAIAGLAIIPVLEGCDHSFVETLNKGNKKPGTVPGKNLEFVTAEADFYNQNGGNGVVSGWKEPNIAQADWKLKVDGLGVDLNVTFADLKAKFDSEGISVLKTLRCVFDSFDVPGLMSTGVFKGVPLRSFLPSKEELEKKGVKRLRMHGSDGFTNNITLGRLFDDTPGLIEPLLIAEMNGANLSQKRGGPVRLLLQETYGYKNVKWIERVELTDKDEAFGTYQDNGYTDDGTISVTSKATQPLARGEFQAGKVKIIGMAFSGAAGISKVEVAIDDGSFAEARIVPIDELLKDSKLTSLINQTEQLKNVADRPYPFRGVWVKWDFEWDAPKGEHTIRIKASDKSGKSQPETDTNDKDGFNNISEIKVTVT